MSLLSWLQGLFDKEEEKKSNFPKFSANSMNPSKTASSENGAIKKTFQPETKEKNSSQRNQQIQKHQEQYTILDPVPRQKKLEISVPFVQPIDTSPMILTEETEKKNRMPDLLGQVTLGNQPKREPKTIGKQKSSFPTFGDINTQQKQNAKTTDAFLKKPTALERFDAWNKGSMNSALYDIDQAGTFSVEQGVKREQERAKQLEQIADEMEAARKAGDTRKVLELQTQKNQLAAQTNSLFSALDLSGWTPQSRDENPFYGEMQKNDEILKRGLNPAEKQAVELAQTAGNMLARATVSAASGASLPLVNAVSQFGQAGTEALEKGHDPDTALQYALTSGALSYGIEKMGGVAGDWGNRILKKAAGTQAGKNLLSKVPETALQYIQNLSQNKIAGLIGEGVSEGGEELGEYSLQLLLQNMMLDEDTPFDVKEALANAGAGVLFGTAFKTGDLLTDLDVSRVRTGLEKGIRTGEIKEGFQYPTLETREMGNNTDADTLKFIDNILEGNLVPPKPEPMDDNELNDWFPEEAAGMRLPGTAVGNRTDIQPIADEELVNWKPEKEFGFHIPGSQSEPQKTDFSAYKIPDTGKKSSDKWNVTPDEADFSQEDHLIKPWIITPKENLLDDSLVDWEPDAESGLSLPESVQKARQDSQGNIDTSILSVPEPNFNSPLLLNQRAKREREATRELVDKREKYLAERKVRTQDPEPTPPPETESFVPEQSDLQEAESFLNQQAETSAPDRIRTETEQKAQNQFFQKMQGYLPVSGNNTRENFRKALDAIGTEYQALGRVSPERAIRIFSELYDSARVTNNEYYNQYRPLKEEIRNTRFYLSDTDRTNISDFESFRKANVGNFTVTKDLSSGIPVDVKYRELSDQYPELFSNDITNPAAQLERISEISKGINPVLEDLDSYYGREASEIRRQAQEVFWNELHTYLQTLDNEGPQRIKSELSAEERNNIEKLLTRKDKGILDDPRQADILLEAYQNVRRLQPEAYREGLLDSEKHYIDGIVDGSITLDQVPDTEAKDLIQAVASARIALNEARKPIEEYNAARQKEEVDWAKMALIDSDLWKDKMTGLQYQRETMERNIRDIAADKGKAEQIIDHYFTPVHEHEAQKQRFLNQYRDQLREMNLTKEESQWVQKIGEGVEPMSSLPVYLDANRIESAITLLRDKIYPEIYNMVSDALMLNGYAPPGYIQGYFPHFTEPDDPFTNLLKMVGMDVDFRELPTEIAGTTETRKPGKSFFANLLHRQGDQTEYDALKGLDLYLEGAGNVIFHTEDIQKLRVLENVLREKYGRKVNNYRDDVNRQSMPVDYFKDQETEEVFGKDLRHLSKFVTELRSYTNSLAGKKSIADRDSEHKLGRGFYSLSKALENRVAANMVGVNPSSWLTNFVPLTQGAASISKKNLAQAIMDTGDNLLKNDGFEQNSTFLTNRLGSKKVSQTGVERVSDALTKPMEVVDMTTANILVRGRYLDNLEKGMDAKKAMSEADKWTASLMADRSKGALPTIFNEKNFLTRLATMFQVEVNNQWSYLFKDLPRDSKNAKALISAAVQMALYSYLANELYEDVTGRRPAFDPIGWGEEFKEDFQEEGLNSALTGLGENALEQVPFKTLGNFVGIDTGTRYPIESAIPDLTKVWDVTFGESSDAPANYRAETALKEVAKPTYYLLPPVGGGQVKKTLEGMDALLNAGSYKTNREGGKDLQYPVDTDLLSALKILTFGKSSTPQAQEYYETWKPVQPDTVEGQSDAIAKSLPRIVSYTTGEGSNKKEGSVTLSAGQQRQYQELFLDMLPENLGEMPSEKQELYFDYAEQAATDKILENAGVSEYEPESWAGKMKMAVDAGISAEDYMEIKEFFDTVGSQKTGGRKELKASEIKRQNLMDNQKLIAEQKLLLDKLLISKDTKADYTDENSFYRSQMSDDRKKQYDAAAVAVPGISAQEFSWVMNSLSTIHSSKDKDGNTVEGSKKQKQIDYLLEKGFSLQEAYDLYNIQDLPSNFTSASEYGLSYDAYSESMKKQYQAVVSLFGETKTSTFEYYRDLVEGISGSSQKAEALIQNGFTEKQAKEFLSALSISEKDEVDFSNSESVLVSTLSDSQKSKYSAVLNYIPGMPVSDYIYFRDSIENVQGIRDQNGKTISGTSKRNKISALMQMGMNYHQALVFYNIVG